MDKPWDGRMFPGRCTTFENDEQCPNQAVASMTSWSRGAPGQGELEQVAWCSKHTSGPDTARIVQDIAKVIAPNAGEGN